MKLNDWVRCEACGETFFSEQDIDVLEAEALVWPGQDLVSVCEDCFEKMRAAIPEMDADLRRRGL